MDNHEFILVDAEGAEHSYLMSYHGATEGQAIVFSLIAGAAGPLGGIVGELAKAGKLSGALDTDIGEVLGEIDFGSLGSEVQRFLMTQDTSGLVKHILSKTLRDGQPLSNSAIYDRAYAANYGELLKAVFEVVKENGFFPLSGIL